MCCVCMYVCLRQYSFAVKKHHDQSNSYKRNPMAWLIDSSSPVSSWWDYGGSHADMLLHKYPRVLHLDLQTSRQNRNWTPMAHFLKQGHTYSKKAISPIHSQEVPLHVN